MDINSKTKQFATTLNCQQWTQAVMYNSTSYLSSTTLYSPILLAFSLSFVQLSLDLQQSSWPQCLSCLTDLGGRRIPEGGEEPREEEKEERKRGGGEGGRERGEREEEEREGERERERVRERECEKERGERENILPVH